MKVGMVDIFYGTPRGHSYVNRDILKVLKENGCEVHMFRIGENVDLKDFPKPDTERIYNGKNVPKEDFDVWLENVEPDVVFFNEYNQWWEDSFDKVAYLKELGIPTVGYLVNEMLGPEDYSKHSNYTYLIAPSGFQTKVMRKMGLYNTIHTPWFVDFEEIDSVVAPPRKDNKVRFFHCAGTGGVEDRKNTNKIIEAYKMIKDEDTDLKITHLNLQEFSRYEILSFTKYSDILLNPAKWDTIGLNTLEACACGVPAIVCDAPPMNEIVKPNMNGLTVDCEKGNSSIVKCDVWEADVNDLANKMLTVKNQTIRQVLSKNSRVFSEQNFSFNENAKYIMDVFRRCCNG